MEQTKRYEITRNALLGQATGDAFGVPVEFLSRNRVRSLDIREMTGMDSDRIIDSYWAPRIPKGSWSDDTSMTVASMASFIGKRGQIDYQDQMAQFVQWWYKGAYCALDAPFGLGGNVSASLKRFLDGTPALDCGGKEFMDNGNGALMRILPFSLYCIFNHLSEEETAAVVGKGSAITHGHEISRMCCFIWTEFLRAVSEGENVSGAIGHIEELPYEKWFSADAIETLAFVTKGKIYQLSDQVIKETGYVVDTLYSAIYSLDQAVNFEGSIRNAVNLGYDTDTAAAVTGTAAGILYGVNSAPEQWLNALKKREYLESMAREFAACITGTGA